MIKNLFNYFQIIAITNFIFACATLPENKNNQVYQLNTKAKVTDKMTNESYNVDLLIVVDPDRAVRMDVTALLGYRLAEIVLTPKLIQYTQRQDKFFVQGDFKPKTLKPLFKQEIDPKLLWALAHEKTLKDGQYYGAAVKTETLATFDGDYKSKRVTIDSNTLKMVWLFKSKELVAVSYPETFVLSKPDEYKLITIK
jgi:Domain of unknown function (DUF4292)